MIHARTLIALSATVALLACGDEDRGGEPVEEPPGDLATERPEETGGEAEAAASDEGRLAPAVPDETEAALEAMGYLPTAPTDNPDEQGVTRSAAAAHPGVNLYSTRHRASATLVGMDGEVLHEWSAPEGEEHPNRWMHVEPLEGGDLLALAMAHSVTRHRWDSSIVWRARMPAHHDLAVHPDGRIFALIRWAERLTHDGRELPVLVDGIMILSPDGERQGRVELLPLVRDEVDTSRLRRIAARVEAGEAAGIARGGALGDLLHTNSIEFLRHPIDGVAPAGAALLSFRNIDRVAILSPEMDEVLWIWGQGELEGQHDATQLDDGRVLIFDNGTRRRQSRAIEVDVTSGEIVWSYTDEELYTTLRGGAQRLPNGNTLITESDSGHAIEVTRDGEVVWELWNPDVRRTAEGDERGVIYRLNRFDRSRFPQLGTQ